MFFLVGNLLFCFALTAPLDHPDRVANLPGAPTDIDVPLYSGFLEVDDAGVHHKIFYVLAEAIHANPLEAPLIVWMNGGPGASSLLGLLLEHGPYLIDAETKELKYNDFSWNQYANVLYIESPSGVGFSYSRNDSSEFIDDSSTARINMKALQYFMNRVHHRYAIRDFYLAGESYAGAYIPHLSREILNNALTGEFTNLNFKGIAMGNAAVDDFSYRVASSLQLYGAGLIPEKYGKKLFALWDRIRSGETNVETNEFIYIYSSAVRSLGTNAYYDLPLECNQEKDDTIWHISKPARNVECQLMNLAESYLNREEVQQSLHVRAKERPNVNWIATNDHIFRIFKQDRDTIPVYKDIIDSAQDGFRILFYTGDMDLVCPPLQVAFGARRIAEANSMTDVLFPSTEWRYLGDFGGARTGYKSKNGRISIDVLTVRGASHFVPISQPDRAFQIINNFVTAEPSNSVDYSRIIPRKWTL